MSFLTKSKEFLKPFFVVLAFFILCLIISPKDNQTAFLLPLDLPEPDSSQKIFADPSKKAKPESLEFVLVQDNSLQSASPAITVTPQVLGALMEGYNPEDVKKVIVEYIVEPGDSLWAIASHFDISLDTILWANDLNKNAYLQQGQKLIIPPVSGVIHHVKTGDTVSAIAQKYDANAEGIISFNGLSGEADIFIGDILIVPGGEISAPIVNYAPATVPLAQSYFICPIALPCRITQGLHWYNAIDFSHGRCGEVIYAAAAGVVQKVKLTNSTSRWAFGGAGNHLTILHPNGVVTMYGHIATSLVSSGETVYQGQPIALMGGQPGTSGAGMSTGCHLHFGVTGARNPFAY
jgi:LysM repeat protein